MPLTIQAAHDLYAFALTLQYDPAAHRIVDADPVAAGVQAADLSMLPKGAWVVVNRADPVAGEAQVVVTLVAPAAPLAGDLTLARLRFAATGQPGHLPRVTGLAFWDASGASLDVGLAVEGLVTRTAYHLWVPWVGR